MDRFGLIGYPISHSISPALFSAAYGGRYNYDLIETPSFEEAWERFLKGYKAVNVTAPFKVMAARRADFLAPEVEKIGAANILVRREEGTVAHNSDYLGVRGVLARAIAHPESARALVVGFGGAGMAAAQAARDLGMDVTVCNRSTDKAPGIRPLSDIASLAKDSEVLIYNIPQEIPEMAGVSVPVILEANYKNPCLMNSARSRYLSGTAWHLEQAVTGYVLMSGEIPDGESMKKVYEPILTSIT